MAFGCHRSLRPSAILEIKDTQHSSLFKRVVGNATAGAIFVAFLRDLKRRQRKRLEGNRFLLLWLLCQPVGLLPKVSDWQTKLFVATTKNGISHLQNICKRYSIFPSQLKCDKCEILGSVRISCSSSNINQTSSLYKETPRHTLQRHVGVRIFCWPSGEVESTPKGWTFKWISPMFCPLQSNQKGETFQLSIQLSIQFVSPSQR